MSWYTIAWLVFGVFFVVVETIALIDRRPGDTLSEHLRSWFATRGKPRWWQARRAVLVVFLVWFPVHLFSGLSWV